jgi:hypothetical protein
MRKMILFILLLSLVIVLSAFDESKTIGDTTFLALRAASLGGDDIIEHYYQQCLSNATLSRDDWESPGRDMGARGNNFFAPEYANKATKEKLETVEGNLFIAKPDYEFIELTDTMPICQQRLNASRQEVLNSSEVNQINIIAK